MERKHNTELTFNTRGLRKNMTKEERHLWYDFLKTYPVRVLRQKVIDNYMVNFYCHSARMIIELDGSQHYEEKGLLKDKSLSYISVDEEKYTLFNVNYALSRDKRLL